ncbi:hypothetical protein F5Y18DRAFT_373276 [Xylariaceae sp. FL1019]|nr:hypothetical protein F5Y18DRAFT_373276 [Xylariaceae sp. FL1019]
MQMNIWERGQHRTLKSWLLPTLTPAVHRSCEEAGNQPWLQPPAHLRRPRRTCYFSVVFADSHISTFLVMMVLFDHFRAEMQKKRIAFVCAHGGGDTATRGQYCRYIQEDCTYASPCKVVVTSLDSMVKLNAYRRLSDGWKGTPQSLLSTLRRELTIAFTSESLALWGRELHNFVERSLSQHCRLSPTRELLGTSHKRNQTTGTPSRTHHRSDRLLR